MYTLIKNSLAVIIFVSSITLYLKTPIKILEENNKNKIFE